MFKLVCLAFAFCSVLSSELEDVSLAEGITTAGNFSIYEIRKHEPVRIVLHSVSGDADLYIGYKENISFLLHEHNSSSTSCGLDFLDIAATPRPLYLAIYAHPSYNESTWHLLLNFGKNSSYNIGEFNMEVEKIYDWDSINKAKEHRSQNGDFSQLLLDFVGIVELALEILIGL